MTSNVLFMSVPRKKPSRTRWRTNRKTTPIRTRGHFLSAIPPCSGLRWPSPPWRSDIRRYARCAHRRLRHRQTKNYWRSVVSVVPNELAGSAFFDFLWLRQNRASVALQRVTHIKRQFAVNPQYFHRTVDRVDVHDANGARRRPDRPQEFFIAFHDFHHSVRL